MEQTGMKQKEMTLNKLIAIGITALVIVIFMLANINIIESGEVGIKKVGGKYEKEPMHAGFHWTAPWVSVEIVDAHLHSINYVVSKWDAQTMAIDHNIEDGVMTVSSIRATDSRGLLIDVDISVRYQINKDIIPQTISTYGRGWEEMLVNPIVRDSVRDAIAHFPAEVIPVKRPEIGAMIEATIAKKIEALKNAPLFFAGANLREVTLPKKINANITLVQEARQQEERSQRATALATQEALRIKEVAQGLATEKEIQADANAYVVIARNKAQATAVVVSAQADADAIKLTSEAQAEANIKIANSLTEKLLLQQAIDGRTELYKNPALKIVPDNANLLFGNMFQGMTTAVVK